MKYIKKLNIDFDDWENYNDYEIIIQGEFPRYNGVKMSNYSIIYKNDNYFKYLNKWFNGIKNPIVDELWTVKKVDNETKSRLYNFEYNPISLNIYNNKRKSEMKCMIHSVDDASYGIWFTNSYNNLKKIRNKIALWLNSLDNVNGEEFLNFCEKNGADPNSIDYN